MRIRDHFVLAMVVCALGTATGQAQFASARTSPILRSMPPLQSG